MKVKIIREAIGVYILKTKYDLKCKYCAYHEVRKKRTHCLKHNKQIRLNDLGCEDWVKTFKVEFEQPSITSSSGTFSITEVPNNPITISKED